MKKIRLKKLNTRLLIICSVLLSTAIIIHSCKKDVSDALNAENTIALAKTWYEGTYPSAGTVFSLNPLSKTTAASTVTTSPLDFTQHIKPDWSNAAVYTRLG